MSKKMIVPAIIIGVIIMIIATLGGTYNSIVSYEQKVEEQAANIDVTLQRRADLIPNFVETIKGYAKHENDAIDKVTEARTKLMNANGVSEQSKANDELTGAINNLLVVVENYPDLKASANFIQLQDELAGSENRIATARRDYNSAVNDYNTKIKKFPSNIIAGMFGFEKKDLFEASEGAKDTPKVDFN